MNQITQMMVNQSIQDFLMVQLEKKLEPELKALEKAQTINDLKAIDQFQDSIKQLTEKYTLETWMEDAASRMAKQLKFGTHISKGIHPDVKGDNINFKSSAKLADHLIGSQSIMELELDANGNAAALPLASFFNINISEYKLRELILVEHESLNGCFSNDEALSKQYLAQFKKALDNLLEAPSTSELNKQLLWPNDGAQAITSNDYTCLVPLHPSALTHHLHKTINKTRYSEANKQARENRKKKTVEQSAYLSMHDLAYIQLGGTKPQNISQLTSSQRGRNYLLSSIPPQFTKRENYALNKQQSTIFNKQMEHRCYWLLQELFTIIDSNRNIVETRDKRKDTLDLILKEILDVAQSIQQHYAAGWSKEYSLSLSEKYWLDPERTELEGEEEFKNRKQQTDWHEEIKQAFSEWLNLILKKKYPKQADDFNDPEMHEWYREMQEAIKVSQRNKQGVF